MTISPKSSTYEGNYSGKPPVVRLVLTDGMNKASEIEADANDAVVICIDIKSLIDAMVEEKLAAMRKAKDDADAIFNFMQE